jgi:ribosomal protein L7/L12
MKDYKAISEKQAELIDYLISCIENGFDYQIDTLVVNEFQSELALLQEKEEKSIPTVDYTAINLLLWKGMRLAAIKLHFQMYGGSLKDSKAICDELYKKLKNQ